MTPTETSPESGLSAPNAATIDPRPFHRAAALVLCLLLGACAGLREDPGSTWPAGIPPLGYFTSSYEQDLQLHAEQSLDDYLYWVKGFYEGTPLYPRGWNDLVAEQVDQSADAAQAQRRAERLYLLGRDIATEWAKANSLRRVDNRHLAVWGAAAGRAIDEGNVDETLTRITRDLDKLLARELPPDAISEDRYHAPDPNDWFAL